jgi:hypothetical protein
MTKDATVLLPLTVKRQDFFQIVYGLGTERNGTGTVTCQKSEPEP